MKTNIDHRPAGLVLYAALSPMTRAAMPITDHICSRFQSVFEPLNPKRQMKPLGWEPRSDTLFPSSHHATPYPTQVARSTVRPSTRNASPGCSQIDENCPIRRAPRSSLTTLTRITIAFDIKEYVSHPTLVERDPLVSHTRIETKNLDERQLLGKLPIAIPAERRSIVPKHSSDNRHGISKDSHWLLALYTMRFSIFPSARCCNSQARLIRVLAGRQIPRWAGICRSRAAGVS